MEKNTMNEGDTLRYRMDGTLADNFADAVMSYHQPELGAIENGHVYILFNDGEICLTKCGSLLWQRNMNCLMMSYETTGQAYVHVPKDKWPDTYNGFGYIMCSSIQAEMLRWHMGEV